MEKKLARTIRNGWDGAKKRRVIVRWLYGVAASTSLAVFAVFWFTNVYRDAILSNLELRNGTPSFLLWQRPPVELAFRVYVFNYTNSREFERGEASKLRVEQVGPFVYRESLNRVNVELHENGSVTYQEKRSYRWMSGESENETVIVPNVLLMSTFAYFRNVAFPMQIALTIFLSSLRAKPFLELPVGEYLWGYEDKLFRAARPFASLKRRLPFDKFGILAYRNGVDEDRITMRTGVHDLGNIGMIERVNGEEDRKVWGDEDCDKVYGTDGSIFPIRWIERPDTEIHVYAKDLCRRMSFRYESRGFSSGIPTLRYKIPSNVFASTRDQDSCFCPKDSYDSISRTCPPLGTFNVSACTFDAPFLLSLPHFYSGEESLFRTIDGLTPQREHHESYIDLHPRFAVTIATRMRFQLNVEVRRAVGVPLGGNLQDGTILPLVWIEFELDELPESMRNILYRGHYLVNAVEAGFQWCSLIAAILFCGGLIAAFKRDRSPDRETSQIELARTVDFCHAPSHLPPRSD